MTLDDIITRQQEVLEMAPEEVIAQTKKYRPWALHRRPDRTPAERIALPVWGMTLADIARLPDSFFAEIDGDRLQANIYQHAPNGQIQYVYSYPLI